MVALSDELRDDPAGIGYAQYLPDAPGKVVELINAPTQTMAQAIKSQTALTWAAGGPFATIYDASEDKSHPCRASCLIIRATLIAGAPIDMSDPDIQNMFSAWVATNVVTQTQADDLYTRATQPASRAEVLGFGAINEKDVVQAWQL